MIMRKLLTICTFIVAFVIFLDSVHGNCVVRIKSDAKKDEFKKLLAADSTKLVRVRLVFDQQNQPNTKEWKNYRPADWQIVTKVTGQYIMTSHPDIEWFSLGFFTIGVKKFNVSVVTEPKTCLRNISEADFNKTVLNLFFSGLMSTGSVASKNLNVSTLPAGVQVCTEKALVGENTVAFSLFCCSKPNDCAETYSDWWQYFFFYCVAILNFIAFLYIANLVPEYLYKDKYGYNIFLYNFDKFATFQVSDSGSKENVEADAELEVGLLKKPTSRGTSLLTSIQDVVKGDHYRIRGVWFRAPDNTLVSKEYLPIGFFAFLYQRLIKCNCYAYRGHSSPSLRIRHLTSAMDSADGRSAIVEDKTDFSVRICCDLPICNPQNKFFTPNLPKWSTVLQVFMTICSAAIFAIPWILIYVFDENFLEGKRGAYAQEKQLLYSPPFYAFNLLRFIRNSIPGLSIAWMVTYVICIIVVAIVLQNNREERDYVGKSFRSTLRKAKGRWDKGIIKSSRLLIVLFYPFKILRNFGLLALLLWPIWIVTVCPISILVVLLGNAPTVNIFFRLLVQFFKDITTICRTRQIRNNTRRSVERCIVYICLILILFIVHFFVFALISLLVNVIAYTLAGAIITANDTFRYTTFSLLILLNAYDCFLEVEKRYTVFHEKLQAALLARLKDTVKKMARRPKPAQPNSAYRIPVEADDAPDTKNDPVLWDDIAISDKNRVLWNSRSVVQFLDDDDKLYLSEKFFFEACYMDYYGCPGDFATSLWTATRRVLITFAFLAFVVFTLNAYGGLAANSASGLLITLSWGLLPLLINRFFTKPFPELSLDTEEFNFQNKLDVLISDFQEYWEVIDFDVEKLEAPPHNHNNASAFWLKLGTSAVQISVSRGELQGTQPPDTEVKTNDIEMTVLTTQGDEKEPEEKVKL